MARVRARFAGVSHGHRVRLMCLTAHFRVIVAPTAAERLNAKLANQNAFTTTTYFGGEKAGGWAKVYGIDG